MLFWLFCSLWVYTNIKLRVVDLVLFAETRCSTENSIGRFGDTRLKWNFRDYLLDVLVIIVNRVYERRRLLVDIYRDYIATALQRRSLACPKGISNLNVAERAGEQEKTYRACDSKAALRVRSHRRTCARPLNSHRWHGCAALVVIVVVVVVGETSAWRPSAKSSVTFRKERVAMKRKKKLSRASATNPLSPYFPRSSFTSRLPSLL